MSKLMHTPYRIGNIVMRESGKDHRPAQADL